MRRGVGVPRATAAGIPGPGPPAAHAALPLWTVSRAAGRPLQRAPGLPLPGHPPPPGRPTLAGEEGRRAPAQREVWRTQARRKKPLRPGPSTKGLYRDDRARTPRADPLCLRRHLPGARALARGAGPSPGAVSARPSSCARPWKAACPCMRPRARVGCDRRESKQALMHVSG